MASQENKAAGRAILLTPLAWAMAARPFDLYPQSWPASATSSFVGLGSDWTTNS
jgi:hypothetical protein